MLCILQDARRTTWHVMHCTRCKTNYMTCYACYKTQNELHDILCVLYKMQNELHDMSCILQDSKRTTWHVMDCTRRITNYMTCYAFYKHLAKCITTCHVMFVFSSCTRCITNYMTCYAFYKTCKTHNMSCTSLCILYNA